MTLGWGRKTTSDHHEDEEMSMDEILASIRRYVSDGNSEEEDRRTPEAPSLAQPQENDGRGKNPVSPESAMVGMEEDILELKKVSGRHSFPGDDVSASAEITTRAAPAYAPISPTSEGADALSQESKDASVAALSQLMQAIPSEKEVPTETAESSNPGTESMTLDRLLRELARPMIYQWLDQNLPKVVERLVAQELEKITQRLRP